MPKTSALRDRPSDSEKLTVNLGYVDLGHIDLLVRGGFYANRSDFIRSAIRRQLDGHGEAMRQSVDRMTLELGLRRYSRADLEAVHQAGRPLNVRVLGLVSIDDDVPPELARATIASITVLGALQASKLVKAALADRIH